MSEPETSVSTEKSESAEDTWRLNYVTGNLFSCPEDEALAHCISEDYSMGAGIAVMFKQRFKGVEELKEQRKYPQHLIKIKRKGPPVRLKGQTPSTAEYHYPSSES